MSTKVTFKTISHLYNASQKYKADDAFRVKYFNPTLEDVNKFEGYNYIVVSDVPFMKQEEVDTIFGKEFRNVGHRLGQCLDFYNNEEQARCRLNVLRARSNDYFNIFMIVRLIEK